MSSSEWREVKLGDLLNFRRGHDLPKTKMIAGNIPVVGSNGVIGLHNEATTKAPCLTIGRSGNIGNPCYINDHCWAHNTSLYVDDFKGNDAKYLYYLLRTLNLGYYGGGSAVPTLNRNHIHPIEVMATINENEQKSIAATLSCLDDKIELNNRMNKNLEEMAQAIFKSWFVDFEPFQDGEFEESELGMIPKGWRYDTLYEVFEVVYGAAFKSKLFNEDKKGEPLIRIRDLKTFTPQFYTEEKHPKTEIVKLGDILVGMDAEFRPCIWKGEQGVLNQRVCKFIPKYEYISNYFVYETLKPHMEFIENFKVGTTVSHIGKGDIDKIKILIPTERVLYEFKSIIDSAFNSLLINSVENRILSGTRDTLLPKLMSGEIRVPLEEVQ